MQNDSSGRDKVNPYFEPAKFRPRKPDFSAGMGVGIVVIAVEICQSVQDRTNSVILVAEKQTLVRVFLSGSSVGSPIRLRGEMWCRRTTDGPISYVPSMNEIKLEPSASDNHEELRRDLGMSLNFYVPTELLNSGTLHVALGKLVQVGGQDQPFSGEARAECTFVESPPIRVRCIGLRYRDNRTVQSHTPDAVHFKYLRSYLKRAYPVAEVIWSQVVIDADFAAPFDQDTPLLANAQIAAIRNADVNAGADPRTHYYGLVDDANGRNFMRGLASGIPGAPRPDTVASGPCGRPGGFSGDNDLSYADWYGAHELGHTFGRYHPGFPPGEQDKSDLAFPYDNGQLGDTDNLFIGYDPGDTELGIAPRLLDGFTHHDIMTYAERQWVSAYTFEAIRLRLAAESGAYS